MKRVLIAVATVMLAACGTTSRPSAPGATSSRAAAAPAGMTAHGSAGWVGQEFAGRTTANGEIFDPMLMTAAHRTLPFGTLLDVRNPKTGQTVRVRVNDRGPYVGDRLIDLSFAAAQQIGLSDGGGGDVDMTVVKVGLGDLEPPAAFAVNVPDNSSVAAVPPAPSPMPPTPSEPQPSPAPMPVEPQPSPVPATVDRVEVTEQQQSTHVETRKEVAANGTTIVETPVTSTPLPAPAPAPAPATRRPTPAPATPAPATSQSKPANTGKYMVQVGAFSQEANAKALQKKLKAIGQDSTIDHPSLYLVRIGPFDTRDQAVSVRAKLEASGISAIITTTK